MKTNAAPLLVSTEDYFSQERQDIFARVYLCLSELPSWSQTTNNQPWNASQFVARDLRGFVHDCDWMNPEYAITH
jgi:hypothetical protein